MNAEGWSETKNLGNPFLIPVLRLRCPVGRRVRRLLPNVRYAKPWKKLCCCMPKSNPEQKRFWQSMSSLRVECIFELISPELASPATRLPATKGPAAVATEAHGHGRPAARWTPSQTSCRKAARQPPSRQIGPQGRNNMRSFPRLLSEPSAHPSPLPGNPELLHSVQ